MAKTTKNTSTSRTSKTTKKKSNSNWLTSRINFKSRKTQLLFTILTFAVIGGAYYTYRSFANDVSGSVNSYTLAGKGTNTRAYTINDKNNGKNGVTVARFSPRGTITWVANETTSPSWVYQYCSTLSSVSAKNASVSINVGRVGQNGMPGSTSRIVSNKAGGWASYCTNTFRGTGTRVWVNVVNNSNESVDSGVITLQRVRRDK